ncbi:helix-turn-helix transcriptional regulator [Alteromonadaceae bacterium BrNp21-10]|nr:helix-turn-helix transcriptional regulator [Alteromonadaceae bacterium BrNp21-10]
MKLNLLSLQGAMLFVGLTLLMAQLFVRQKQTVHLLFAIFCGSIAMMAAKQIGNDQLGAYQYIVGMGACATCNGFWLVSRALFREKNAIAFRHILAAGSVALLLIIGQMLGLAQSVTTSDTALLQSSQTALYEVVNLFSSCMLVLTAWEGCRGLRQAQGEQLWQRLLFIGSFCSAVLLCTILVKLTDSAQASAELGKTLAAICAIQIMLVTQGLIYWRFHRQSSAQASTVTEETPQPSIAPTDTSDNHADQRLAQQIQKMLEQQELYLQTNLKVADLARELNVSEYRVSRVFRDYLNARNFNQFINQMRIDHAKALLQDPANSHWPILVIGMESGFASVGPFTRAFKSFSGMTPSQYRQLHQIQTTKSDEPLNQPLATVDY